MRVRRPNTSRRHTNPRRLVKTAAYILLTATIAFYMILLIQRIEKLTSFNPLEGQTEGFPRNNLRNIVEDQINQRNDSPSVTHGDAKEAKRLQTLMKRLAEFVKREGKLHFIHIGKTGGTYFVNNMPEMKNAPFNGYSIFNHWHNLKLGNLNSDTQGHEKENHRSIFFVRDPVDRWISGFMSRYRVGCPSHCHLGDEEEMQTFHLFPTPNSLAEGKTVLTELASHF